MCLLLVVCYVLVGGYCLLCNDWCVLAFVYNSRLLFVLHCMLVMACCPVCIVCCVFCVVCCSLLIVWCCLSFVVFSLALCVVCRLSWFDLSWFVVCGVFAVVCLICLVC